MTATSVGFSLLLLGLFLVIGKWILIGTPVFQKLFLPSSLVAGLLALIMGPEILGSFSGVELLSPEIITVWETLPGLMINLVFAALFIGKKIPNIKKVWELSGPQVILGYIISFGQYVVGLTLSLLILAPFFGMNPLAGALIEIGFVGGHGTAAGLRDTFVEVGFPEGADLAIGLATVGVLSGVLIGIALINWGVRKNKLVDHFAMEQPDKLIEDGVNELENRELPDNSTNHNDSIEPLSLHLGYICIGILIGSVLLNVMIWIESITWGPLTNVYLFPYVPLFPLAMIGGIMVELVLQKFDRHNTVDRMLINRIQGMALDILIASALATLSLSVIEDNFVPFLILSLGGICWTVFAFIFFAPKILPNYWFERGIGDFGQSMGVTATGLLLMRIADGHGRTPAMESFGYKQLFFELFMGGGLFTAASIPLIYQFGPLAMLVFTGIGTILFVISGLILKRKKLS